MERRCAGCNAEVGTAADAIRAVPDESVSVVQLHLERFFDKRYCKACDEHRKELYRATEDLYTAGDWDGFEREYRGRCAGCNIEGTADAFWQKPFGNRVGYEVPHGRIMRFMPFPFESPENFRICSPCHERNRSLYWATESVYSGRGLNRPQVGNDHVVRPLNEEERQALHEGVLRHRSGRYAYKAKNEAHDRFHRDFAARGGWRDLRNAFRKRDIADAIEHECNMMFPPMLPDSDNSE